MQLRDSTVAGLCLFLMFLAWLAPIPAYGAEYEGIDNDNVNWSCGIPIISLAPATVDLDQVRAELAADAQSDLATSQSGPATEQSDPATEQSDSATDEQTKVSSRHPQCAGLARTQLVMGLLCGAAGIWRGRRWWVDSADARAEKKFKRLHERASGKPTSRLF